MANTTTKPILNDAVKSRIYASGIWKLRSIAHFGGDDTGIADMCLLQDKNGKPFIPGTSIAGAARSLLAHQCLTWVKYKDGIAQETPELKRLFGGAGDNDKMSALIVADAMCESDNPVRSVRDGVGIDANSGIALDKAKFDIEVVERGTEFKIELECIIRKADAKQEKTLRRLFLAILYAFQQGDIQLGARTRRGYGSGKVEDWNIYDLNMEESQDVIAWLQDKSCSRPKSGKLKPRSLQSDQRHYFRIEADFQLRTSLLIRGSSGDPDEPDMAHLHSNDKPVLPGTSFAGAFRHRAALIANALDWSENADDADADAVCEMFGPVHKQNSNAKQQTGLWASRVLIEERLVENVKPQWQDRVAIDRFTGGSLQSALFNEKPVYPVPLTEKRNTNLKLRLTLEEPEKAEIGLLLLTLRDFWYGHAALGGETSNGRGTLQGVTAKLIYKDNTNPSDLKMWKLKRGDDNKCMTIEKDGGFLQSCVSEAQNYSNCPSGSRRPKKNSEEESDAK